MLDKNKKTLIVLNTALFLLGMWFFLHAIRPQKHYPPIPTDTNIARYASSSPQTWHVDFKEFPDINKVTPVPSGIPSFMDAERRAMLPNAGTEAKYMYGMALYRDGQYSAALTAFRSLIPASKRYYSTYLWAGYAAMGVGDLKTSVDMFGYIIGARGVDPKSRARVAADQGNCLWEMGLFDEATRAYNGALASDRDNATALIGITDIALRQNNQLQAEYHLKLLESVPLTEREKSIVALLHQR